MSMHLKPLTSEEEAGLRAHGLPVGGPSQLADAFRLGMAWAEKARAEAALAEEVRTYVQAVPDHCDRITWRGAYYHLTPSGNPTEGQAPDATTVAAIERILTEVMDEAARNGADSRSMPDDYVAVAAWLCGVSTKEAPQPDADTPWRDAVIVELLVACMLDAGHEADPSRAVKDLITYHSDLAVDPRVSEAAARLVEQARGEEREACALVCESRQTPGTGSVAILQGAADAIRARGEKP